MSDSDHLLSRLRAWGPCRPLAPLGGGHRNAALLIERSGERLVAKTTRRSPRAVAWLTRVHEAAAGAGFVVPAFVPDRQGRIVVDGVTVERWIEGAPAGPGERRGAAAPLRAFHQATRDCPQRPGFASSIALLREARGGDVDLQIMPSDLVRSCRAAWRALAAEPTSVVHGDLNLQNVLRTPGGRLALIDWDEARVDVSVLDEVALAGGGGEGPRWARARRALMAWEVAACWHVEPAYARRLAAALTDDGSSSMWLQG